jgi:hypothetical protein
MKIGGLKRLVSSCRKASIGRVRRSTAVILPPLFCSENPGLTHEVVLHESEDGFAFSCPALRGC